MAKRKRGTRRDAKQGAKAVTRAFVDSLRGRFKGKGLMRALIAEKKKEARL